MVIRFAPNKNINQKAEEEQAVWRGTNCYDKISHQFESSSNLHGSVEPYVIKFHEGKLRPV